MLISYIRLDHTLYSISYGITKKITVLSQLGLTLVKWAPLVVMDLLLLGWRYGRSGRSGWLAPKSSTRIAREMANRLLIAKTQVAHSGKKLQICKMQLYKFCTDIHSVGAHDLKARIIHIHVHSSY